MTWEGCLMNHSKWFCTGVFLLLLTSTAYSDWTFIRGDVNGDGSPDVGDAITGLDYMFQTGSLNCFDATDVNDDGAADIADMIYLLTYLFSGGPEPAAPFLECGVDPTPDSLGCDGPNICPASLEPPASPTLNPHFQFTSDPTFTLGGQAPEADSVVASTLAGSVTVPVVGGEFLAVNIPLQQDAVNNVYFTAYIGDLASAPTQTMIIQDVSPPQVSIQVPTAGAEILTDTTEVLGTVSDLLSGSMAITVTVDGIAASVDEGLGTTGTFLAVGVPLDIGENIIEVVASDNLGNTATQFRTVTRIVPSPSTPTLTMVSGNAQTGPTRTMLADPIVVQVLNGDGSPFANKLVNFTVTRNNGWLNEDATAVGGQVLSLFTDVDGFASVRWGLGSTAGQATNRVRVASAGVAGTVTFCASATAGPASQINLGDGNNQYAETNGPAPFPLRVWVSDGLNGVAGAMVNYAVVQGGGLINGAPEFPFATMATGHAEATFVAGPDEGLNIVTVTMAANPAQVATFYIYGVQRNEDDPTNFIGAVQTNSSQPIEGVTATLTVGGEDFEVLSDPDGKFEFYDLPNSGPGRLTLDGSTATLAGGISIPLGSFPSVGYPVVVIPDAENKLPQPVLLPRLDPQNEVTFDGSQDIELTVVGIDGLVISVPASTTITLKDGTVVSAGSGNSTVMSLNRVNHDDLPMSIPDGAAPPFAWTVQPAGAHFDPPLPIQYPNMSALEPGSIAYFLSYNHDNNRFEIVCAGTTSLDGSVINSDPDAGLTIAGWGCNCPPYSATGECCEYEPQSNGCGPGGTVGALVPDCPYVFFTQVCFSPACDVHDICYGTCACGSLAHKIDCDVQFYLDILSICSAEFPGLLDALHFGVCANQAYIYYLGVFYGGLFGPYGSAQDEACQCEECGGAGAGGTLPPGVDPPFLDLDEDVLPDEWELEVGLDPTDPSDATMDFDGDTLTSHFEYLAGTHPFMFDTDGNGTSDAEDFAASQPPKPDVLDDRWQVTVNGNSVEVGKNGTYKIPNVTATDQFGAGGPGTAPDFQSDEQFRVIGTKVEGDETLYAWTDPFRITQGERVNPSNVTISSTPPPFPESILLTSVGAGVVELGQSVQLSCIGKLVDDSTVDLTSSEETTYRVSNNSLASVDANGLVTSLQVGFVMVTATNNGATSARGLLFTNPSPQTTIIGLAQLSAGVPVENALIEVDGTGQSALTDATGFFSIPDVVVTGDPIGLTASVDLSGTVLTATTTIASAVVGGQTDAGIFKLAAGPAVIPGPISGSQGSQQVVSVYLDTDIELRAWSFGVCHDSAVVTPVSADTTPFMEFTLVPDFELNAVVAGEGASQAVVISFLGLSTLSPGTGYWTLDVTYDLIGAPGTSSNNCVCSTVPGATGPVVSVVVDTSGASQPVDAYCGAVEINP